MCAKHGHMFKVFALGSVLLWLGNSVSPPQGHFCRFPVLWRTWRLFTHENPRLSSQGIRRPWLCRPHTRMCHPGFGKEAKALVVGDCQPIGIQANYFTSSGSPLCNHILSLDLWSLLPISKILFCDHSILLNNHCQASCARHSLGPGEWLIGPTI